MTTIKVGQLGNEWSKNRMPRALSSIAVSLCLVVPLARDEFWSTAGYAAMLRDLELARADSDTICDCTVPTEGVCQSLCEGHLKAQGGWICGWYVDEMDRQLEQALRRGDRPDVIEQLIGHRPDTLASLGSERGAELR